MRTSLKFTLVVTASLVVAGLLLMIGSLFSTENTGEGDYPVEGAVAEGEYPPAEGGVADGFQGQYKVVSAGADHSCAVRADDTITCWGADHYGQLDSPGGRFKSVSAGAAHTCGLRTNNTITCWGADHYGQLD